MGRKRTSSEIDAFQNTIVKYKTQVLSTNKIVSKRAEIWKRISDDLNGAYSPLACYTAVAKNYYDVFRLLDIESKCPSDTDECGLFSDDSISPMISDDDDAIRFDIKVTYEDFLKLRPQSKKYSDVGQNRKGSTRIYYVFEKRLWTHYFYEKISPSLKQYGCICVFMFKRAKIHLNSDNVCAYLSGSCKECRSVITGKLKTLPDPNKDGLMEFSLNKNASEIVHSKQTKRPLSGELRYDLAKHLVDTNVSPSEYLKKQVSLKTEIGVLPTATLPKPHTMRVAKHEFIKKGRTDNDPFIALCILKVDPSMRGAIRNIGADPFFVHYWTNVQLHVYNRYCDKGYSIVCIDATGSVVKKIMKLSGEMSHHIFLYECTVRDNATKQSYSVANMLSESHNAVTIHNWLVNWTRSGAKVPNEVVTDMSLALMYAVIATFTKFKTLKEYLDYCYEALFSGSVFTEKCYIRNDVAHVIKLFSGLQCLKKKHKLTRQFYLKTVGQIIQTTSIDDVENIIRALFIVALSDTEGISEETGNPTTCEIKKQWLKRRIATAIIELPDENNIATPSGNCDGFESTAEDNNLDSDAFQSWTYNIAENCRKIVNQGVEIGDRGNMQHLPLFVTEFIKLAKTLPLWTGILKKFFPSAPIRASSACVESSFNNIKHRVFRNSELPARIDDFLKIHVTSTDGSAKLNSSCSEDQKNLMVVSIFFMCKIIRINYF